MGHKWPSSLDPVFEANNTAEAYFLHNGDTVPGCIMNEADPTSCAGECTVPRNIFYRNPQGNGVWLCALYANVTNEFRTGNLPEANKTFLDKNDVDTSLGTAQEVSRTIATCLAAYCDGVKECRDGAQGEKCSVESLVINNGSMLSASALDECIELTCSTAPKFTANTDIAGIGVLTSYAIQFGLVVTFGSTMAALKATMRPSTLRISEGGKLRRRGTGFQRQKAREAPNNKAAGNGQPASDKRGRRLGAIFDALFVTLIEIQRAQCLLSIAISVATLTMLYGSAQVSLFDRTTLLAAGNIGSIIPVTLNLVLLAAFNPGRRSWYVFALTLLSWVLVTAVIASPRMADTIRNSEDSWGDEIGEAAKRACGLFSTRKVCGENFVTAPGWATGGFTGYACLLPAMLGLTVWQFAGLVPGRYTPRFIVRLGRHSLCKSILLTLGLGTIAFSAGFYFFNMGNFFESGFINRAWSYGQIIAFTVWMPSVATLVSNLAEGTAAASTKMLPESLETVPTRRMERARPLIDE